MATLERMVIDYQALTLFCVDQTPKISNLLEDLRKVERFAQYIENQGIENLTKGTTSFQSDAVEEMNGEKRRR